MNIWLEGYAVDAVWVDQRLVVGLDSRYHDAPAAIERDPVRDARLQLARYRILRVTYRRLTTQPDELAKSIGDLLATA
jgi:very-short-patch-repair endonuclease